MNRFYLIAPLCSLMFAAPVFAAQTQVTPNEVACKDYASLNKGAQLSLSAWLDGYSSTDIPVNEVQYSPDGIADMQKKLLNACGSDPDQTLGDIEFDYGGTDTPFAPTCAAFLKLKDADAANMVLWALGYVDYNNDVENVNMNALPGLTREILAQCRAVPDSNMLELTMKSRKIAP